MILCAAKTTILCAALATVLCAAPATVLCAAPATAATQEQIGSWLLNCPTTPANNEQCLLRLQKRFLDKAGVTGDLEIMAEGKSLVPVITLCGLPPEILMAAAMSGRTEASLQFAGEPRQPLQCAPSRVGYVCSPHEDAARALASNLPGARAVTVRISVLVPGLKPLPVQERSVDLTGTNQALTRLRNAGPSPLPGPMTELASQSPAGLMAVADKMLRSAGYPNGVADLQRLLAKYRGK